MVRKLQGKKGMELRLERPERIAKMKGEKINPVLMEESLIPERYRENFELKEFVCNGKIWKARLEEKEERIPKELQEKEPEKIALNGFCKKVEVADFPLKGIPVILEFYRRRWKEKGGGESFSNTYELHLPGMKCTEEFGVFLKGLSREAYDQYIRLFRIDGLV